MALKGTYETVKQAIQDVIAPDLERIKGQIVALEATVGAVDVKLEALRGEMHGLRNEMHGLRNEMQAGFRSVDDRIDALKERAEHTGRRIDETLEIRERLAALETWRATQHS